MAKFWPSLNAHHSATTLVVCPIDLENPLTQSPWQSLITPPPLALPGFSHDAPSVLSLCQPPNGLIHLTGIANLEETWQLLLTQKKILPCLNNTVFIQPGIRNGFFKYHFIPILP